MGVKNRLNFNKIFKKYWLWLDVYKRQVLGPRYEKRTGGYTQIIKLGQRRGDGAETVILKLV